MKGLQCIPSFKNRSNFCHGAVWFLGSSLSPNGILGSVFSPFTVTKVCSDFGMRLRFSIAALLFQTTLLNNKFHIYALVVSGKREGGTSSMTSLLTWCDAVPFFWSKARPPQQTQKLPFDFSLCLVVCSVSKQLVRPRSNTSSRGSGCETYRLRLGLLSNTVVSLGTRASRRADCNETTTMHTKLQNCWLIGQHFDRSVNKNWTIGQNFDRFGRNFDRSIKIVGSAPPSPSSHELNFKLRKNGSPPPQQNLFLPFGLRWSWKCCMEVNRVCFWPPKNELPAWAVFNLSFNLPFNLLLSLVF